MILLVNDLVHGEEVVASVTFQFRDPLTMAGYYYSAINGADS